MLFAARIDQREASGLHLAACSSYSTCVTCSVLSLASSQNPGAMVVYDPPAHELVVYQSPNPASTPNASSGNINMGDGSMSNNPLMTTVNPLPRYNGSVMGQLQPFRNAHPAALQPDDHGFVPVS